MPGNGRRWFSNQVMRWPCHTRPGSRFSRYPAGKTVKNWRGYFSRPDPLESADWQTPPKQVQLTGSGCWLLLSPDQARAGRDGRAREARQSLFRTSARPSLPPYSVSPRVTSEYFAKTSHLGLNYHSILLEICQPSHLN